MAHRRTQPLVAAIREGQGRENGRGRENSHLAAIRAEEAAVEAVEQTAKRLRQAGRGALGVTGRAAVPPLRETLGSAGVGMYPAAALGLLVAVDQLQTAGLTIMGPEIAASLGIGHGSYASILILKSVVVAMAALPIAALVQRRAKRAAVSLVTALGWAVLTVTTGFVVSTWGLLCVAVAAGAASGSVRAVHESLLLDSYPPAARVRVVSSYRASDHLGEIAGPLVIGVCTVALGLTWRGAFFGLGAVAFGAALLARRLRDPGFGPWDTAKVREVVRSETGIADHGQVDVGSGPEVGFAKILRQLMLVPTVRRTLGAVAVMGMLLAPFLTYLAFFLQERWGMGPGARAGFMATMPLFGIVGLCAFGRRGEELFREDPARLLRLASALMGAGVLAIAVAPVAPVFLVMALLFGAGLGMVSVATAAIALPVYSIVPAHARAHLGALLGIVLAAVGGTAGLLLLGAIDKRYGASGAIVSLAVPGVAAALALRSAAGAVNADLDRLVDGVVEDEEIRGFSATGRKLPMLACRHIDFAYDQLQVLFDVDFTVDDGEMVALLGTNGAGKSTLLRVISGLGHPSRGSVRFRGADITSLDPERRVDLGVSLIPGGRAVFGPMTVAENLRLFGHTLGRDRRRLDEAIERCFDAFPRLAERRNQNAVTLSGGEQQMLALSKALILRPRLLLIDELSLGLAPVVVGQLLEMVRKINAQGAAVVLVEQSVNIALSLVDHAYFMEKGEMRFDGRSQDLLERGDLLRAVFLEGATKGIERA